MRTCNWTIGIMLAAVCGGACGAQAAEDAGWYTQGNFAPVQRYAITLKNPLDFERPHCGVTLSRQQMPVKDLQEMWVTVVDPSLPSKEAPTAQERAVHGAHLLQRETHGHAIFHQLDDLDKDGIWDELYFQTDMRAGGSKTIYLYVGFNQRGWNPHETHAEIGSYARHLVPFWESKMVGWKLWFPTSVDVYGKRVPQLISQRLDMDNMDGYGVPRDMGSDIQSVDATFGAGGICVFEKPDDLTKATLPRFTPAGGEQARSTKFNAGPLSDTRYSFDVVANGPLRSSIRVRTMNWKSGAGDYAAEQLYTAYANESYSTCRVKFTTFAPANPGTLWGCGFRKKPEEKDFYNQGGVVISSGPEEIKNPDEARGQVPVKVDFIGGALAVREIDKPRYTFVPDAEQGNHALAVAPTPGGEFEYMIACAWSEGPVLKNAAEFKEYVIKAAAGWNHPLEATFSALEKRP
jgi:hypothetical protein